MSDTANGAGTAGVTRKEEALWLLERLVPGSGVNNLSFAFRVAGKLAMPAFREALSALLRRHDTLRTVFQAHETGLVKRTVPAGEFEVPVDTIVPTPAGLQRDLTAFVARSFPLDGTPLVRFGRLASDDGDVFCLAAHHLVFDTISASIVADELRALYSAAVEGSRPPAELAGTVPVLPDPEETEESLAYWRERLAGYEATGLNLWCGAQDAAQPTLTGRQVRYVLDDEATAAVRRMRKELRASEAIVLLAAYCLLLAQHGAGPDLVIGSPVNTRPQHAPRAVGYHVNVLPLRATADLSGTFAGLVRELRGTFLEAIAHADVSVDTLSAELPRSGSSWRDTLFRHLFNYVPGVADSEFDFGGLNAEAIIVQNGFSKFDLEFFVMSSPGGIRLDAVHYTEILSAQDVKLMVARYETLLKELAAKPGLPMGEIGWWSPRDRAVIGSANETARADRPATPLSAFLEHVRTAPDRVFVEAGEAKATFQQIWDAAVATSTRLRECGVNPGDFVAVLSPRGAELVAAVLGVWLSGAAYVPIDPSHPAQRIAYQLADSKAKGVLLPRGAAVPDGSDALGIPMVAVGSAAKAELDRFAAAGPDSCAYLIYTSGSTGKPKGTLITHRALANVAAHVAEEFGAGPGYTTLWMTTFAFDMSAIELYLPMVCGGRIAVAPDEARTDGRVLLGLADRHDVDLVQATPTTWRMVLDQLGDQRVGRHAICGGEPLPLPLARRLFRAADDVLHLYGPTETTVWSTARRFDSDGVDHIDVGGPISNTEVFVLSPDGRELPLGLRGELCIAGDGVALGYHERPELTEDRFRVHPRHGRYYRTGDQARWCHDGTLELLGRADRQVKVRGNRIELEEVEAVLLGHPGVLAAAVVVAGEPGADAILAAFVVAGGPVGTDELWEHARSALPPSAVPHSFVVLDKLPVTTTEKIDYPALRRIAAEQRRGAEAEDAGDSPGDATTGLLLALWQQQLDRQDVNAGTNFFTHGGHSLLGAQLVQQINERTGADLRLADLFAYPSPAALAERVQQKDDGQ